MRVGVDGRHLTAARGVSRYATELLDSLAATESEDEWLVFVPGRGDIAAVRALGRRPNVSVRRHALAGKLLFGAAALTARPRLDRMLQAPLDVVWIPAPAPVALSPRLPYVLTVHDLSFELRPRDFTPYERLWHRLARPRDLALGARLVIVPSAATQVELETRWRVPAQRVRVVEEGVRGSLQARGPGAEGTSDAGGGASDRLRGLGLVPGGYLLAVGALEPRKAPELLVRAFARARARGLQAELVFAGQGRLADRLRAPGVRLLGQVSDAELDALYAGTLSLVTSSLLEGYGLPVREALAHGRPAIVSDLPAFGPELSEALLRFPVGDEAALAELLLRVARDDQLRERLAAAAQPAVAGLSWERAARKTRAVLAEAAGRA